MRSMLYTENNTLVFVFVCFAFWLLYDDMTYVP
jgi:hypothetical protein